MIDASELSKPERFQSRTAGLPLSTAPMACLLQHCESRRRTVNMGWAVSVRWIVSFETTVNGTNGGMYCLIAMKYLIKYYWVI
jgi:hypothetical protein